MSGSTILLLIKAAWAAIRIFFGLQKPDPDRKERCELKKQIRELDAKLTKVTKKLLDAIRSHNVKLRIDYDNERLQLAEDRRLLQQRLDDLERCPSERR